MPWVSLSLPYLRLLSAFCTEELTHIYDDEGAYRLLTNEDNILEVAPFNN